MTHTIILDFDDTIINSHEIQIRAWISTINMFKNLEGIGNKCLHEAFQTDDEEELSKQVTKAFFEHQHAKRIINAIFKTIPNGWTKRKIDDYRFGERKRMMLDQENPAAFFDGFRQSSQGIISSIFSNHPFCYQRTNDPRILFHEAT